MNDSQPSTPGLSADNTSPTPPIPNPEPLTDRHWDATARKVVIHNVLKYIRPAEITKLTSSWIEGTNLVISKTKKPPQENWMKVTLAEDWMVDEFIALINGGGENGKSMKNGRGGDMFAKRATEMDDRDTSLGDQRRKRKDRNDGGERDAKRPALSRVLTKEEVCDAITPLWRKSYEEQLNVKAKEMVNKCSKSIVKEIKKKFRLVTFDTEK
jgi:hypothetical protein